MYKSKRWAAAVFAVLLLMLVMILPDTYVSAAKDRFETEINTELDASGRNYVVSLDIMNKGKDFTGYARVLVKTDTSNSIGYDVDISIPSATEKTYSVTIPVNNTNANETVEVEIYDKKDRKEYEEKFRKALGAMSHTIKVGVLSDNLENISFLDISGNTVMINGYDYFIGVEEMSADTFSEKLKSCSALIINDYDTSALSEDDLKNLKNWVASGGALLVGTGENYNKTMAGKLDIYDDLGKIEVIESAFYTENSNDEILVPMAFATSQEYDSTYNYVNEIAYYKNVGSGTFTFIMIDLEDLYNINDGSGVQVTDDMIAIYTAAFSNISKYNNHGGTNYISDYVLSNIEAYMEKPAKTGGGFLVFLIVVYVALVGPVIYLILKAMNQREKMWIVIPAVSLLFVIFIVLISLGVRVKGLTLKSVRVQDLSSGEANTYVFGYHPSPETWSVKATGDFESATISTDYNYSSSQKQQASIKNEADGIKLAYTPDSTFDMTCFSLLSYPGVQSSFEIDYDYDEQGYDYDEEQDLDYDYDDYYGTSSGIQIKGTVKNNTGMDFDYVLIFDDSHSTLVEDVQKDEVIDIDMSNFANTSYYSGYNDFLSKYANTPYKQKKYDDASEIAALSLAYNSIYSTTTGVRVVGVRKTEGVTNENEASWNCYYDYK